MKVTLKTSFLVFLLFASFISADAATITWLGGNGAWEDPSEWDTGTAPSYGDDVIIPSGYCRVYGGDQEGARSVEVHSSARLYIYEGGHLEIQGTVDNHGLHNWGRVYIYGELAINSITRTNSSLSANAIRNEKYIFTYSNSIINIKYIEDDAIHNTAANSYFRVRGGLYITSVDERAIFNEDRFYNSGVINISNSGESSGYLIVNSDSFRNYSEGTINLNSNNYGGFLNNSTSSQFRNYGDIYVYNTHLGFLNNGTLLNSNNSLIRTFHTTIAAANNIGATIDNSGEIISQYTETGFENYGEFINNFYLRIYNAEVNGSLINHANGIIHNYHNIILNADGPIDIENHGDIYNYNGGYIAISEMLDMSYGSSISNYGFFISNSPNSHNINGSFGNKGVIDDNQGMLQGQFPNDRLIIAPVTGPMQVGVPYPNVLDVASLEGLYLEDWKISQNGAIAGNYNESTNVFTPNANAAGISTIYISVEDIQSGHNRNFTLEIDNPILPFTKKSKTATTRFNHDPTLNILANAEVNIYPNPSSGNIQMESELFVDNQIQVLVFNSLGQVVQQAILSTDQNTQSVEFANHLTNGLYIIKTFHEGLEIDVNRIQLQR